MAALHGASDCLGQCKRQMGVVLRMQFVIQTIIQADEPPTHSEYFAYNIAHLSIYKLELTKY